MTFLSVLGTIAYYVVFPVTAIFNFLLILLAPMIHSSSYALHALFLPFSFLGKFETLYIFFGVAALVGLFTGTILHFTSSILISLFNLQPSAEDEIQSGRTAASVRAARQQKTLDDAWQTSLLAKRHEANQRMEAALSGVAKVDYSDEWAANRKDGRALLSQTILEEEDDSEDAF